jgi:hypothetical protein
MRKEQKLEKRRVEALSSITGERLAVEQMAQRPRRDDDPLDHTLLEKVLTNLTEIEGSARKATNIDDLDDLIDDAEMQGQFRAYLCPREDIWAEGCLAFALIEEWGVPKAITTNLHKLVDQPLKNAKDNDDAAARGALRTILGESDEWRDYTTGYEDTMNRFTRWLFGSTIALILLTIVALHFPVTVMFGLLLSGTAGSCISVMTKMPVLEVSLSKELDSYERRILSRIGVGVIASLIGCGLLGWGFISFSIHDQTFADVLNACSTSCSTGLSSSCTALRTLVLMAVSMLFGFSERALASLEQRVFGKSMNSKKSRD